MQLRLSFLLGGLLVAASPAFAQVQVFNVVTAQPGTIDFRGLGTANYNNSTGTNNGISLGSSSSLTVSNSLSASKEYTGTTSALVQLTGEGAQNYTNFLQTIGSSTGAANMQAAAASSAQQAHSTATSKAEKATTSVFGINHTEYLNNFNATLASQTKDASGNIDFTGMITQVQNGTLAAKVDSSGTVSAYDAGEWDTAYNNSFSKNYNETYNDTYSTTASEQKSLNTSENQSGKVVGKFETINTGSTGADLTASDLATLASQKASALYGSTWDASGTTPVTYTAGDTVDGVTLSGNETVTRNENGFGQTMTQWQDAYGAAYDSTLMTAAGATSNSSTSDVEVEGIGNIASVGTQETSTFQVDLVARNPGVDATENGTANGSSAAALSTTSTANVNSSQFSSAFIQAFAPENIPQALLEAQINALATN